MMAIWQEVGTVGSCHTGSYFLCNDGGKMLCRNKPSALAVFISLKSSFLFLASPQSLKHVQFLSFLAVLGNW